MLRELRFHLQLSKVICCFFCSSFIFAVSSFGLFAWQPEVLPASWNKITTLHFCFSFRSVFMQLHPKQDGFRFPKQHFIGQSLKLLLFRFQCFHTHTHTHSRADISFKNNRKENSRPLKESKNKQKQSREILPKATEVN